MYKFKNCGRWSAVGAAAADQSSAVSTWANDGRYRPSADALSATSATTRLGWAVGHEWATQIWSTRRSSRRNRPSTTRSRLQHLFDRTARRRSTDLPKTESGAEQRGDQPDYGTASAQTRTFQHLSQTHQKQQSECGQFNYGLITESLGGVYCLKHLVIEKGNCLRNLSDAATTRSTARASGRGSTAVAIAAATAASERAIAVLRTATATAAARLPTEFW